MLHASLHANSSFLRPVTIWSTSPVAPSPTRRLPNLRHRLVTVLIGVPDPARYYLEGRIDGSTESEFWGPPSHGQSEEVKSKLLVMRSNHHASISRVCQSQPITPQVARELESQAYIYSQLSGVWTFDVVIVLYVAPGRVVARQQLLLQAFVAPAMWVNCERDGDQIFD